ncbi:MAG: ATP/GTP-binding protein [Lachnospirales bacterium]
MLTYVKLKNFMSFKDAVFNFKSGKKTKKFISIYGENGSGKSNFVNSINLLRNSIESFTVIDNMDKVLALAKEHAISKQILDALLNANDILYRIESCRLIDCEEPTTVEYGFEINGHDGYYIMSFSDRFLYEKLYYYTGKQRGVLFEIKNENGNIVSSFSTKLFSSIVVKEEMVNEIEKFWGKHTFLSVLNKERKEKNENYIKENYLDYVFDLLDMLQEMFIHYKKTSFSGTEVASQKAYPILDNLKEGKINVKYENIVLTSEKILNDFFTQAYADIKSVYYKKTYSRDNITYKLFVKKMIGGKIRTLDFEKESAGTQHILDIIRSLLGVFCGVVVVYDEIDDGIHDLLLKNILDSMIDDITGQLIITTHNTYILESIDAKSAYVITVDYLGNKCVKCLDEFQRIQGSNNKRIMYLKGMFGGIPIVDTIYYDLIINELKNGGEDSEGGE